MEKPVILVSALACLLLLAGPARAWSPECRAFSQRLATDPGSLRLGELDVLKSCLSELQRRIVAGETPPEPSPTAACPERPLPPPVPAAVCEPCPQQKACPRVERNEKPEDPVRQRYIPRY